MAPGWRLDFWWCAAFGGRCDFWWVTVALDFEEDAISSCCKTGGGRLSLFLKSLVIIAGENPVFISESVTVDCSGGGAVGCI